jgi:hypothetical protein
LAFNGGSQSVTTGKVTLFVPANLSVQHYPQPAGQTMQATLTFVSPTYVCTYSRLTVNNQSDADPLPLTSCTGGVTAGSAVVMPLSTSQLSLNVTAITGSFSITANVAKDIDDQNPCTTDTCSGGVIQHTNLDGTVADDGNPCNGTETCVAGMLTTHTAPPSPITSGCNTLTCDPAHGGYYVSSSMCTPPSAPSTGAGSYGNGTTPSDIWS